jgi:hypothetical protein
VLELQLVAQVEALAKGSHVAVPVPGRHHQIGAILLRVPAYHRLDRLARVPLVRKLAGMIDPGKSVLDGCRAVALGTEFEEERAVHRH